MGGQLRVVLDTYHRCPMDIRYAQVMAQTIRLVIGLNRRKLTSNTESRACTGLSSVCLPQTIPRDQANLYSVRMCELAVEHAPSIMVDPYEALSVGLPPLAGIWRTPL